LSAGRDKTYIYIITIFAYKSNCLGEKKFYCWGGKKTRKGKNNLLTSLIARKKRNMCVVEVGERREKLKKLKGKPKKKKNVVTSTRLNMTICTIGDGLRIT
jgi:hypothetical protein